MCACAPSLLCLEKQPQKGSNVFSYCRFEAGSLNQLHVSCFCCFLIVTAEHLMNGRRTWRSGAPAAGNPRKAAPEKPTDSTRNQLSADVSQLQLKVAETRPLHF